MRRWLRVLHYWPRLTHEARCGHCGDLVFYVTEEELVRRRRAGVRNPFIPTIAPSAVAHDCRKFTNAQLLHNGRKPR
jgi:hypothetical protein